MNKQEIFDISAKHLLAQGAKSQDVKGQCVYRGPYGLMCAIGPLIRDEDYNEGMEKTSPCYIPEYHCNSDEAITYALEKNGIDINDKDTIEMILFLQKIHDNVEVKYWRERLEHCARDANLKMID